MSGPESPAIAVESTASRWSRWWLASGSLFLASALLAAFRSLPGALDGGTLSLLATTTTVAFSLALASAGIAAARRDDALRLSRGVVVALLLLAIWVFVGQPLLNAVFDVTSAAPLFVDPLVKLGLSGVVVAGVLRSPMPTPWRYIPAIALAAVVAGSLMEFAALSGSMSEMSTMFLVSNIVLLVRILAAGALGAVALRAARSRSSSVVVFGG